MEVAAASCRYHVSGSSELVVQHHLTNFLVIIYLCYGIWSALYLPELALIDTRATKINPVPKGEEFTKGQHECREKREK